MEQQGALSALAVAAAAVASVWNTHRNGFVWDDRAAIVANKDVRAERALWQVFTHDFWGTSIRSVHSHKSYRPLTVLSFRLSYWASGGDTNSAQYFHAGNMLIHVACSLLVWRVARALFLKQQHQQQHQKVNGPQALHFKRTGAMIAALLFAVHPIHCDAVASVVGRADLLCTMLSLLGFLSYVAAVEHHGRTKWSAFVLAIVYAVEASLCKELGFTVFGLFLAYDLITQLSSRHDGHSYTIKRPTLKDALSQRAAALVLVTLALTIARVWINGEHRQMKWNLLANNVAVQSSKWTRALSYAHVHAWYLWKLLWPRSLCFDYGFKTVPLVSTIWDFNNVYTLAAYSAVATGVYAGIKQLSKSPVLLISIAFGVVPFIPASNLLFPVGTVVAERLLYFPSVGFCLLAGHVLQTALRTAYKYGSADIVGTRSRPAEDAGSLKSHTFPLTKPLKDAFRRSYALITLCTWSLLLCGSYRSQLRNAEWASETTLFNAAFHVSPTNNKVLANIGKTLLGQDDTQAIRILRVATAIVPQQVTAHANLGLAHWNVKNTLFATRHLHKAAHFSGDRFQDTGYLGGALFDHWLDEHQPIGFTREAFHSSPTILKARANLDLAIAADSYYPIHYYTRARLAYFGGDFDDAIRFCELTLRMNNAVLSKTIDTELLLRRVGQIYNLMAISYSDSGRKDLAIETIAKGLQLEPNEADLHANAVMLYVDRRDRVKSNEHLNEFLRLSTTQESVTTLLVLAQQLEKINEPKAAAFCRQRAEQLTGTASK